MNKWFVFFLIFLFSISLRLWNLNQMGRTWDEGAYAEVGYKIIESTRKGNFGAIEWYDHPPLARYFYGIASYLDVEKFDNFGNPIFKYDLTSSRLVSILFSSLSTITVALIGWKYVSPFVGISASLIFSMLPFFVGFSQIATLETFIMFFFSVSFYTFLRYLEKPTIKWILLTGIFTGLALEVKQSNVLLFPLFLLVYIIWYIYQGNRDGKTFINKRLFSIPIILILSIGVFVLLWPNALFSFKALLVENNKMWVSNVSLPPPEVFFGRLILVPKVYYIVYFLITTPLLILILFLVGLKTIDRKRGWILLTFFVWFIFPFIQTFYNFRQHGLRYIIEVYAPLAIISAIGLESVLKRFQNTVRYKILALIFVFIYLFIIDFKITPYYLDYFNEIVGGTKNVYEKRLFQLGWWGQGVREAGLYLKKNAPKGSTVGLAISPIHVMYPLPKLIVSKYSDDHIYDYVIVNYFNVLREGYDDSLIKKNYNHAYSVMADGASLVDVYKRK